MTVAAGDAHEFPIYAARHRVYFPLLDADGDLVTAATTPDSERSIDGGTFADCSNEMTELATGSGVYYLDLIATETTSKSTVVIAKSATAGMKTTVLTLYPKRMPILRSGTAQAGAASTITLDSGASAKDSAYVGMYIQCSNNSPANVQGQTRKIVSYVGSTKVATVEAAWGTNPSSATTFDILVPETVNVNAWMGKETADWSVAGVPEVDVTHYGGTAGTFAAGIPEVRVNNIAANAITAASINADAITDAKVASDVTIASVTGSVGSVTGNVGGNVVGSVGSVTAGVTLAASAVQAIWDALTTALTTAGSIGKLLVDNINATISSRLASASYTTPPTANENADALLDRAAGVETGLTPRQALRVVAAATAGKLSGAATATNTIRNAVADSKDRITATVDADGNRTAVSYDLT